MGRSNLHALAMRRNGEAVPRTYTWSQVILCNMNLIVLGLSALQYEKEQSLQDSRFITSITNINTMSIVMNVILIHPNRYSSSPNT
jgi:hypothetical protein